jgi:calcineurin-like phosphoesterase family protein
MSVVRYISDPHFGHRNMAIKSGFVNEEEMNKHIVKEWNSIDYKPKLLSELL